MLREFLFPYISKDILCFIYGCSLSKTCVSIVFIFFLHCTKSKEGIKRIIIIIKLPSATDLARRILEAKQVMEQSSSDLEMAISTTTTRSQSNLRSSQSEVHIEDDSQSEPQIEDASQSEPQIEDASQSEPHQQRRSHRRQPDVESYAPRRSTRRQ